jgi:hypothetical protein
MFNALSPRPSWFWPALMMSGAAALAGCSSSEHGAGTSAGGNAGNAEHAGDGAGSSSGGDAQAGSAVGGSGGSSKADSAGSAGALATAAAGQASGGSTGQAGSPSAAVGGGAGTSDGYWKPSAGVSWQWQLTGTIDQSVDVSVYDIDGFDNDASVVKALHDRGRKVICYLSVGSYEDWRSDAKSFPAAVLGNDYPGWPGERFVDIRAQALRDIIAARFDLCKQKGFDGIEPDNMDVYSADSGFPLTKKDGTDYANWLSSEAHARGLNIGQKNASEIAQTIQAAFDWVLTEDCYDQGWCADVSVYVDHDKPVFMSEYTDTGVDFGAACTWGKPKKYSPILKGRDLDAPVQFCP